MHAQRTLAHQLAVGSLVIFAIACTDDVPTAAPSAAAAASRATLEHQAHPSTHRTIDDEFAALVDEIPGFGGLFVDSTGALNVFQTDPASPGATAAAIREFADRRRMPGLAAAATRSIRLRGAAFDFRTLLTWQRAMMGEIGVAGVTSFDVDETKNQIVVGIESADVAEEVVRRAVSLKIPRSAVTTSVEPRATLLATLRDSTNRAAGLQINRGYGDVGACTLGPLIFFTYNGNAVDSTSAYFVTASHCTESMFGLDNSWTGQPDMNRPIGYEVADPPRFTYVGSSQCPASDPNYPGEPVYCRNSDAALYVGVGSMNPFWHGTVYATPGDDNVNITDTWSIATEDYPYVGQTVHKTGRTTGSTSGSVQKSCVTMFHSGPPTYPTVTWLLCQGAAGLYSRPGDSGSPVVTRASGYSWLHNPMTLVGLLWGGEGSTTYFSPWPTVKLDLGGNMKASR